MFKVPDGSSLEMKEGSRLYEIAMNALEVIILCFAQKSFEMAEGGI